MPTSFRTALAAVIAAAAIACSQAPSVGLLGTDVAGGSGTAPFVVSPAALDFPTLRLECAGAEATVTITNRTQQPLRVTEAQLDDADRAFETNLPRLPFTLGPRSSLQIPIRFIPQELGEYAGSLRLEFDVVSDPVRTIALRGRAVDQLEVVDSFEQLPSLQTDVVFVVDSSSSMRAEQQALRNNFLAFIREADAGFSDYRVAVTTTDMDREGGRFVPLSEGDDLDGDGYADDLNFDGEVDEKDVAIEQGLATARWVDRNSEPSPAFAFRRLADVGAFGDAQEQGLEAAVAALTPELRFAPNAFFFRDEALLSIIFVSDEDDQSPQPVRAYTEALLALAPSGRVRVSAVVGLPPEGCVLGEERAAPAPRYAEIVSDFGGALASICTDDWSDTLEQVSGLAFGLIESFPLSGVPESTPEVRVDGTVRPELLPSGTRLWSYDAEENAIQFEPLAIPVLGSEVEISYTLGCPAPS